MTDSPIQPDSFNEELLSGYLDGELSSDEQAQVEHIVQQDPRAQQLLEDMEQLRQCLQDLPENQSPADARRRVLEQIHPADPVDRDQLQQAATRPAPPVRAIVSWVVAAAAGVALLFIVPPLLQDSTQVASNRDAITDSNRPEESNESELLNGNIEMAVEGMAMDSAGEMGSFDESIPVVYVTVPADAVEHIDAILAANSIRSVGPAELNERLRANGQYRERNAVLAESARLPGPNADAAPGGSLGGVARSLDEEPAPKAAAEDQRQQVNQYRQHSLLLLEGTPEELEAAWEQIGQHKDSQLVQQAGPQLKGLKYDANAYRDESLADKSQPGGRVLNQAFGGGSSRGASSNKGAEKRAPAPAQDPSKKDGETEGLRNGTKEKSFDGLAATRKRETAPGQIVIQLIIQVAE